MTKKTKNEEIKEIYSESRVGHSQEDNQEKNTIETKTHDKMGYMAHTKQDRKLGHHCSECKDKSVSQEEFDKMVKVLLNTPPRKRSGKRK